MIRHDILYTSYLLICHIHFSSNLNHFHVIYRYVYLYHTCHIDSTRWAPHLTWPSFNRRVFAVGLTVLHPKHLKFLLLTAASLIMGGWWEIVIGTFGYWEIFDKCMRWIFFFSNIMNLSLRSIKHHQPWLINHPFIVFGHSRARQLRAENPIVAKKYSSML